MKQYLLFSSQQGIDVFKKDACNGLFSNPQICYDLLSTVDCDEDAMVRTALKHTDVVEITAAQFIRLSENKKHLRQLQSQKVRVAKDYVSKAVKTNPIVTWFLKPIL
ncbi:MAG: hypothetical protein AAGA43_15820 [Bacteroidota bacterium]